MVLNFMMKEPVNTDRTVMERPCEIARPKPQLPRASFAAILDGDWEFNWSTNNETAVNGQTVSQTTNDFSITLQVLTLSMQATDAEHTTNVELCATCATSVLSIAAPKPTRPWTSFREIIEGEWEVPQPLPIHEKKAIATPQPPVVSQPLHRHNMNSGTYHTTPTDPTFPLGHDPQPSLGRRPEGRAGPHGHLDT